MTPPYRFISFTALLLTSGTRKRPPQSGSVQTGFEEIKAKAELSSTFPPSRLLDNLGKGGLPDRLLLRDYLPHGDFTPTIYGIGNKANFEWNDDLGQTVPQRSSPGRPSGSYTFSYRVVSAVITERTMRPMVRPAALLLTP